MGALIVGTLFGSGASIVFWAAACWLATPILRSWPLMRRVMVYMVAAAFILIDLFAFAIVGRWGTVLVSSLFSFATGLQTVAALAAIIGIRRARRQ